jgi:hypothetical protein
MRTTKDFKDAGLVLVTGDKVDGVTGDPDGIPLVLAFRHDTPHDAWTIRGFAWRKNTGEKPSFKGDIEWFDGVNPPNNSNTGCINWDSNIEFWRPLLTQLTPIQTETEEEKEALDEMCRANPEWPDVTDQQRGDNFLKALAEMEMVEPEFTQEMYNNGEMPKVGMIFSTEAGEYIAEYTNEKSVCFTDENGFLVAINRGYAKPLTEPLIDGNAYMFDDGNQNTDGIYDAESKRFYFTKGRHLLVSSCTNIRPLTLAK